MSRHLHHSIASDISHTLHNIQTMSNDEITQLYGIEINPDGTVFDPTYEKTFESLATWAEFEAQYDEMDYSEQFGHGKQTHDDHY